MTKTQTHRGPGRERAPHRACTHQAGQYPQLSAGADSLNRSVAMFSWPAHRAVGYLSLPRSRVGARSLWTTGCCESFKVWSPRGTSSAEKRVKPQRKPSREGKRAQEALQKSPPRLKTCFTFFVCSPFRGVATPRVLQTLLRV